MYPISYLHYLKNYYYSNPQTLCLLQEFKTVSGTTYAQVYYDEETNTIMDVWNGVFGSQDNFKKVILFVKEEVVSRGITKWLADLQDMKGSFDGSREWMVQEIMPKLIQSGLLYEAIVLPLNVFSKTLCPRCYHENSQL